MCCPAGICGTDMDPDFVSFATMLAQFHTAGIQIDRYNLAMQPTAFAQNAAVKTLMMEVGTEVLPIIFWDGKVQLTGRYPTKDERVVWRHAACPLVAAPAA